MSYNKKQNTDIIRVAVKKKLLNIILKLEGFQKKKQKINMKACKEKEKKQKENMGEIGIRA